MDGTSALYIVRQDKEAMRETVSITIRWHCGLVAMEGAAKIAITTSVCAYVRACANVWE